MNDFLTRLKEEKIDVHHRMVSLRKFIQGADVGVKFADIDEHEQKLLKDQHAAMERYYGCINQRDYFHTTGKWPFEEEPQTIGENND